MARKASETLSVEEMKSILQKQEVGYLCMSKDHQPYGLPLSYAWVDEKIVIHCGLEGKKIDLLRENPKICFIVSRDLDPMKPHHPRGKCKYHFESVICLGTARVIDDIEERFNLLCGFKSYFYKKLGLDDSKDPVTKDAAQACGVIVLDIETMTGRRNPKLSS